jgi:hypothetical protein
MTRPKITADDVREMLDLRAEGCSNAEIAERTGWSAPSVLKAIGKQPKGQPATLHPPQTAGGIARDSRITQEPRG